MRKYVCFLQYYWLNEEVCMSPAILLAQWGSMYVSWDIIDSMRKYVQCMSPAILLAQWLSTYVSCGTIGSMRKYVFFLQYYWLNEEVCMFHVIQLAQEVCLCLLRYFWLNEEVFMSGSMFMSPAILLAQCHNKDACTLYVCLLRYYWLWFYIKINKLEHSFLFKYTCVFGNVRNRTGEQIRQSVFVH